MPTIEYISHRVELGERIRDLRMGREISGRRFSLMVGISRTYLRKMEDGSASPTFDMLERIAAGLGVTVSELTDFGSTSVTEEYDGQAREPQNPQSALVD